MARRSRMAVRRRELRPPRTQTDIARICVVTLRQVKRWEAGTSDPFPRQHEAIADAYDWPLDRIDELFARDGIGIADPILDDAEAWELARRVEASDVGPATLGALEAVVIDLGRSYSVVPPRDLLDELRTHRRQVTRLLDGRASLAQRRTLVVLGGWLSLLAACVHVDLGHDRAAITNREIARGLGLEAGHPELVAWSFEVAAWQAILAGRHREAVGLCRAGRELVAKDTSAQAQLSVQQARALARLGETAEVHALLDRSAATVDRMGTPTYPDHHFVFDPRKHVGYTATTLAWLGDVEEGEQWARRAVDQYRDEAQQGRSVRRLATARIDLALLMAAAGQPDEAAHLGTLALDSGRLVPSNVWRATELDTVLNRYDLAEVEAFHAQYVDIYRHVTGHVPHQLPRAAAPDQ